MHNFTFSRVGPSSAGNQIAPISTAEAAQSAIGAGTSTPPNGAHRIAPPPQHRSTMAAMLRRMALRNDSPNADSTVDHGYSMEMLDAPHPIGSKQILLQHHDEIERLDGISPDLVNYVHRDIEARKIWLQDTSQPAPLIVNDRLRSWALPHLHAVVTAENRRREAALRQRGEMADSLMEAFDDKVESYGLRQQETLLARLIEERTPIESRSEYRLTQRIQEKAHIQARIDLLEHPTGVSTSDAMSAAMTNRLAHWTTRRQRAQLDKELTKVDQEIHQLAERVKVKEQEAYQRHAEVKAHQRAMKRSFKNTAREASDELSELPLLA